MKSRRYDALPSICSSPLLGIHSTHQHGIVMQMSSHFELGDTLILGFHLRSPSQRPHFISVEVIVIESQAGLSTDGDPIYLVTALFSQCNRSLWQQLLAYSQKPSYYPFPSEHPTTRAASSCQQSPLRMLSEKIYLN